MAQNTKTVAKLHNLMASRYKSNSRKLKTYIQSLPKDFLWGGNMNFGKWSQQGSEGYRYLDIVADFVEQGFLPLDLSGKKVLDVGAWTGQSSLLLAAMGAEVVVYEESKKYVDCIWHLSSFFNAGLTVMEDSVYVLPKAEEWGNNFFDYVLFSDGLHHVSDPVVALRILYNSLVEHTGTLLLESACNQQTNRTCTYSVPTRALGNTTGREDRCNWFIPSVVTARQMCLHTGFATATAWQVQSDRVMMACSKKEHIEMSKFGLSRGDLR